MTFSDLMLKRMIARAARGILIVFQVGKEIEISNFIIDDPCIIFYWKFNIVWLSWFSASLHWEISALKKNMGFK
uniref:Uncharacterized protein n=1 Tax=Quercus lobata TaxID=97700 RepID=A0A7N2LBL2_QUELO